MTWSVCAELAQRGLVVAACVAAPFLAVVLVAGIAINVVQSATSTSDPTTAAVPRLVAAAVAVVAFGGWMLAMLAHFWADLWTNLPHFVR